MQDMATVRYELGYASAIAVILFIMKETIKYLSIQEKEAPINVLMTGVSICDKNHH